ncbi:hypothetical protein H4696_003323 [Amycolatopsis lexingtonensis]|uniref:Uncharacterized protein n=1 Tax=Amycolatopsis lexingtonensis TaxID=218822 RepID=A0ABR9HZ90_9PSEU|nr:hypothetical protein [Amycolatopsis lexingtonensis]
MSFASGLSATTASVVRLDEGVARPVPAAREDLAVDAVALPGPVLDRSRTAVRGGQADAAVERDPAHQAAVGEALAAAAGFPNAFFGLVPVFAEPVEGGAHGLPVLVGQPEPGAVGGEDAVQGFAVDVELELCRRLMSIPITTWSTR